MSTLKQNSAAQTLAETLREQAASGDSGDRFPSVRELVQRHKASPVTVTRAIQQLTREGLVEARPGAGTFIASRPAPAQSLDLAWQSLALSEVAAVSGVAPFPPARPGDLSIGGGYPDTSVQPLQLLSTATARVSRKESSWQQCDASGFEELRSWFARDVGGGAGSPQVVITPGGQAALSTVFRAIVPPGGLLATESPTYFGAIAIARAAGIQMVPIATDENGILPDALDEAITRKGIRAVYLQPTFSNPTGSSLSESRRAAVAAIVRRHGVFLIEDDYARDLAFDGRPPAPLLRDIPEHVVYVRSLTKTSAAGLRVAAVIAFGPVIARVRNLRAVDDWFVSPLLQAVALEVVTSRGWPQHVRQLASTFSDRNQAAVAAIHEHLPGVTLRSVPLGGFSLWLDLPSDYDERALVERAQSVGVHVTPGRAWFPDEPVGPHLRISVAGAPQPLLIEAIARLGRVW